MEKEITDYISQAQKHGLSDFEIKQNLLNAGWEAAAVEDSFAFAKANENRPQTYRTEPVNLPPQQQTTPAPQTATAASPVQSPHPAINISEQQFVQSPKKSGHSRSLIFGIIFVILLLAAGGAYGYYVKVYNTPDRVWNKFLKVAPESVFTSNYNVSYGNNTGLASTSPVFIGISGTAYTDGQDPKNIKASNNIKVDLKSSSFAGPFTLSFNLSYLILNKILYIDLSKIDQLKEYLGSDISWVKIDFDEIQNYAKNQGTTIDIKNTLGGGQNFSQTISSKLGSILKPGKFLAKEDLNGTPVYHLKNEFDAQAFTQLVLDSISKNMAAASSTAKQMTPEEKGVITAIINKVKVKELDSWIGQKDYRLYKIHAVLSAPSPADLENSDLTTPLGSAQAKSRDAKRLSDVRQTASALELYYNDKGSYPQESKNGQPVGLVPTYIGKWPVAPQPTDGTCTDYYNTYWYEPAKNGQDYTLTFCLGADTGGYKAGIGKLTMNGLQGNITCPSSVPANCINPNPAAPEDTSVQSQINKLNFDAEIKLDVSYSDFGKTQNLPPPVNPIDILDLIKNGFKASGGQSDAAPKQTDDEKRLLDIRNFAGGLELYFQEKDDYPDKITDLSPTYLGKIPVTAPSTTKICSDADNAYVYKKTGAGKYTLNFCLGVQTGGYEAGKHTLSQAGIN